MSRLIGAETTATPAATSTRKVVRRSEDNQPVFHNEVWFGNFCMDFYCRRIVSVGHGEQSPHETEDCVRTSINQ